MHLRVPEEQLGRKLRCFACNRSFVANARQAMRTERTEKEKLQEAKGQTQSIWVRLTQKTGDTAVMLDGAIGGAIGGILVGLLVGSVAGANKPGAETDPGGAFTGVFTGIFLGFIGGFAGGALVGVILGLFSKVIGYLFEFKSTRACVTSGILAGASVAVVLGDRHFALVGGVIGGVGAILWSIINGWAESYMPPTPARKLSAELEDDMANRRHVIDESAGDYPRGMSGLNPRSFRR
jgi:hypothetical protein